MQLLTTNYNLNQFTALKSLETIQGKYIIKKFNSDIGVRRTCLSAAEAFSAFDLQIIYALHIFILYRITYFLYV